MLWPIVKTRRIIDRLRKVHPGAWRYDAKARQWICADGCRAWWCAALAPRYDGDDDSFSHELRLYRDAVNEIPQRIL